MVIEDDPDAQELYRSFFDHWRRKQYEWTLADTGEAGLALLEEKPYDALVLDLTLPGIGGASVLNWLAANRETRGLSVIIVSGKSDTRDRVAGLRAGADDYLAKPFHVDELAARLEALLRRHEKLFVARGVFDLGWLQADPACLELRIDGTSTHLEPKEHALLIALLRRPNMSHRAEHLWSLAWDEPNENFRHVLEAKISSLRLKLGKRGPDCLLSHKGVGYSFQTRIPA